MSSLWKWPGPAPEQVTTAGQLWHVLTSTPHLKVEINLDAYRLSLEDSSGTSLEAKEAEEAERIARCLRAGVKP